MTAPLTPDELDKIEARAAAATEGPWHVEMDTCDCGGGYPCDHPAYAYVIW